MTERNRERPLSAPDARPEAEQPAWRRDFPVDVPQGNYVTRRDFAKFLVLTSLAFVAGQFWIVLQNWVRRLNGQPPMVEIAKLADVPVGATRTFAYPGPNDPCVLVRPDENTLLAYGQKCTHLSCAVLPNVADDCIDCPCHMGRFDLRSGRPIAGPPRRPLSRVVLEVQDGVIRATRVELRTV